MGTQYSEPVPELPNKRWEDFARNIASGKTASQAWFAAGFSAKGTKQAARNGHELQRKEGVRGRIIELANEIRDNAAKRAEVDREWVLKGLMETRERCMQAFPVLDREGKEIGEWTFNAAGASKANELIGKEIGMFKADFGYQSLDDELRGMSGTALRAFLKAACIEVGLRVMDMSDDDTRTFILRNRDRVGLGATPRVEDSDGAETSEAVDLRAVPEAGGVPPTRRH